MGATIDDIQMNESVNEANSRDEYDAKEFWGVSKLGIQLHKQFKGRFNKSKFEKALSDLIGKSKRPESTIKIIGRYLNIKPSKLNSYTSGEIIEDQEFIKDSTKKAEQLYKIFVSSNETMNEGISVFDERHFGKKGIIIMIDDNGKKVSAIFKDKKNADKYNRNNPSDIQALLKIAKTKPFGKAIDESVNEVKYDTALADFNTELEKNSEVRKAAKHYKKSTKDVVKVLQSKIKVNRYRDNSIKQISINYTEDGPLSSKVTIKLSKKYKQNESVNEGASTEEKRIVMMAIKKIAKYRNVPLNYAVGDVIRAAEELERTIKK